MRLFSSMIGKQILSLDQGRRIGTVCDLYLDTEEYAVAAIFLGYDNLFGGNAGLIEEGHVVVFGRDAILTVGDEIEVIANTPTVLPPGRKWIRGYQLVGRELQSVRERPLGRVVDLVFSEPRLVLSGFALRPQSLFEKAALTTPRSEVVLRDVRGRQAEPPVLHVQKPFPFILVEAD